MKKTFAVSLWCVIALALGAGIYSWRVSVQSKQPDLWEEVFVEWSHLNDSLVSRINEVKSADNAEDRAARAKSFRNHLSEGLVAYAYFVEGLAYMQNGDYKMAIDTGVIGLNHWRGSEVLYFLVLTCMIANGEEDEALYIADELKELPGEDIPLSIAMFNALDGEYEFSSTLDDSPLDKALAQEFISVIRRARESKGASSIKPDSP